MNKINKSLLSIGTLGAAIAPIAVTVSCAGDKTRKFNILPTYTGQADQLIALGIKSDYYPMQLNAKTPLSYLTNPGKFMVKQDDNFKHDFTVALNKMMPSIKGPSWWNQDAKNSDDNRIDNTYWQKQDGNIMLYEHYLLDDDQKIIEQSWAPKHKNETAIETNFRASRDPYTRIPKGVFFGWDISNSTIEKMANGYSLTIGDLTAISEDGEKDPATDLPLTGVILNNDQKSLDVTINGEMETVTKADAKIIKSLRAKRKSFVEGKNTESDWFYNDWFFVDFYHRNFLDNSQFNGSKFKKWIVDSTKSNPFDDNSTTAQAIKKLFDSSTYRQVEVENGLPYESTAFHHPIYEQQGGEIGAAPMFEGAMRDNQLYLFNVSSQVSNLATYGTPYGKQHYDSLPQTAPSTSQEDSISKIAKSKEEANQIRDWIAQHVTSNQLIKMKAAFNNANTITDELHTRMEALKKYFNDIGVNGKTFGIFTIAPGKGVSTIQSMSKYSFIYKELGFKQPIPANLSDLEKGADEYLNSWNQNKNGSLDEGGNIKSSSSKLLTDALGDGAMFNMDDNGWFWNISSEIDGKTTIDHDKIAQFKGTFDMGVVASNETDFNAEVKKNDAVKIGIAKMFDQNATKVNADLIVNKAIENADYNLWNEGLKTPFVMHMLLDQIMKKAEEYAKTNSTFASSSNLNEAKSWGNYFTKEYLK